jgi:hypothetical protein
MNAAQTDRFQNLKKKPSLLNQGIHGCCGFAAVLMYALSLPNSADLQQLCKTIFSGAKFKDIAKSVQVKSRIAKRETAFEQLHQPLTFDAKLCIGLMIVFKEYLKQHNKEGLWETCVNYSQLFGDWNYGEKISLGNEISPFSYKHGDLALTFTGCQELLHFFTGVNSVREAILNDDDFKLSRGIPVKVKQSLTQLKKDFRSTKYKGAILGLAANEWKTQNQFRPHGYIAHWVYIPGTQPSTNADETVIWTWGMETKYADLKEDFSAKFLLKI